LSLRTWMATFYVRVSVDELGFGRDDPTLYLLLELISTSYLHRVCGCSNDLIQYLSTGVLRASSS
jgi:hypothetical protein